MRPIPTRTEPRDVALAQHRAALAANVLEHARAAQAHHAAAARDARNRAGVLRSQARLQRDLRATDDLHQLAREYDELAARHDAAALRADRILARRTPPSPGGAR